MPVIFDRKQKRGEGVRDFYPHPWVLCLMSCFSKLMANVLRIWAYFPKSMDLCRSKLCSCPKATTGVFPDKYNENWIDKKKINKKINKNRGLFFVMFLARQV